MRSRRLLLIAVSAAMAPAFMAAAAPATATVPLETAWGPIAVSGPTHLPPGGTGKIAIYAQNVGGLPSSGAITLTDSLPAGVTTAGPALTGTGSGPSWSCSGGAGESTVQCTINVTVPPGLTPNALIIPVNVPASEATLENDVSVEGGGAAKAGTFKQQVIVSPKPAKPGVEAFTAASYDPNGEPSTRASSHPFASIGAVFANTVLGQGGGIVPAGDPKTVEVSLPPGFLGNPTATPRCTEGLHDDECPVASQIGVVQTVTGTFGDKDEPDSVHSVEAPVGYPAKFTFSFAGGLYQGNLVASLRSDEDYGVALLAPNIAQISPVYGSLVSIWGTPADSHHNEQRCTLVPNGISAGSGCGPGGEDKAFVTLPADCPLQAAQPPFASLKFNTWLDPLDFDYETFAVPAVTECDQLSLVGAGFTFRPEPEEVTTPSTPTGFKAVLTLPEGGLTDPNALAAPPPKRTVITFPEGLSLNAGAADGLATCSEEQIGRRYPEFPATEFPEPNRFRFDKKPAHCPDASKIGTLEAETALLDKPLKGAVYLAAQNENPFGSTLAIYLVIEDPSVGITIKLPGEMHTDPLTGQVTTTFDDLPQAAVGKVTLKLKGGDHAPLATPETCGTFTTNGQIMPWSAPESATPTVDSFEVKGDAGCPQTKAQRPFKPTFAAGTAGTAAGSYTPLEFRVVRKDGEQELTGLQITLPPGLTGKLAGIATCSDGQIAAAEAKSSGKSEQASPSCPASSQLGTVSAAAGIGPAPIHIGGKVYLAGPYKGAPLSVVAIVPAVAGPFDLGNVVTRTAAYLDPVTAQLRAVSDPIPHILKVPSPNGGTSGISVELKSLRVVLDRPGFSLTPTNCSKMSINATLIGTGDTTASASEPFQVGGCENLAFKPRFSAKLRGGTKRNDHPSLSATLSYPPGAGYANTAFAQVALPHSEFLDQSHIGTVCTRVQFAAHACPKGSIYGEAEATTPLLDEPLKGPVYLRSSEHKLPDVVIALQGPPSRPVEIDLDGRVDSIHGGIRNTFEMTPDAPVSSFTVTLKGGNKGLLVNSRDLCAAKRKSRVTVRLLAQNGKRADQFPVLHDECGKRKQHKNA